MYQLIRKIFFPRRELRIFARNIFFGAMLLGLVIGRGPTFSPNNLNFGNGSFASKIALADSSEKSDESHHHDGEVSDSDLRKNNDHSEVKISDDNDKGLEVSRHDDGGHHEDKGDHQDKDGEDHKVLVCHV